MKILFISKGDLPDYQSDMILHGGRSVLGEEFVDLNRAWYMYHDDKKEHWNQRVPGNGTEYGRGFTIAGTLWDDSNVDRHDDIKGKIEKKYFNKIIYGSIHRCHDYIETVLEHYDPKDIIFVDGEDSPNAWVTSLFGKGMYFKRELTKMPHRHVYPISFAIPKEKILHKYPEKTRVLAHIIPGQLDTYIYDNELDYYKGYQESYFGMTHAKGGWDCLRHYEILANRCIPYFPGLDVCPHNTMMTFPKGIIRDTNEMFDSGELDEEKYEALENLLYCYTTSYLTTAALIGDIIDRCDY